MSLLSKRPTMKADFNPNVSKTYQTSVKDGSHVRTYQLETIEKGVRALQYILWRRKLQAHHD